LSEIISAFKFYKSRNNCFRLFFCVFALVGASNTLDTRNTNKVSNPNPFISEISITIQKQNIKQATFTIKNILGQPIINLIIYPFVLCFLPHQPVNAK